MTVPSFDYFETSKALTDIGHCRDLTSVQAIVFMNLFILCVDQSHVAYTQLSVTLTLVLRMGLHRFVGNTVDYITLETSKKVFWTLRTILNEITSSCGMPKLLHDTDIDQQAAVEVNDPYITKLQILHQPFGEICHMSGANAFRKLFETRDEVAQKLSSLHSSDAKTTIDTVLAAEVKLRSWIENLPDGYHLGNTSSDPIQLR